MRSPPFALPPSEAEFRIRISNTSPFSSMKTLSASHLLAIIFSAASLTLAGCNPPDQATVKASTPPHPPGSTELQALAQLQPTQGHDARGTVRFSSDRSGVRIVADLTGLTPGKHGIHLHENGDCSAPDASSAGGHFNPTGQPHASPDSEKRHLGDLGNLTADANGRAQFDYVDSHLSLSGPNGIIGCSVVVHAGRDDLTSQPSGDSGPRVACGAIEMDRANF